MTNRICFHCGFLFFFVNFKFWRLDFYTKYKRFNWSFLCFSILYTWTCTSVILFTFPIPLHLKVLISIFLTYSPLSGTGMLALFFKLKNKFPDVSHCFFIVYSQMKEDCVWLVQATTTSQVCGSMEEMKTKEMIILLNYLLSSSLKLFSIINYITMLSKHMIWAKCCTCIHKCLFFCEFLIR